MENHNKKSLMLSVVSVIVVAIIVVVVVLIVRNQNSTNSLSSAQESADSQQITANWKTFFAAKTSLQNRENLLQDGSKFTQPIQSEFNAFSTQASSAVVSSVTLTSSTAANVVYTVDLNAQPVLKDQVGKSILVNNVWQVSDSTLCGLLTLGGDKPSACTNN
jgi:predicted PurR-regulated permease PerM